MPEVPTASGIVAVHQWSGAQTPPAVEQSMTRQGMGWDRPFSPGRPLSPFDGGGTPRSFDYQAGRNITARPTRDGRVPFATLKGIIDAWSWARICIGHRIDDVRSLGWSVEAAEGVTDDVTTALAFAKQILKRPEGPGSRTPFGAWLAKYLEDVLRYDAGALHRRRNRKGDVIGLKVVSGPSIAPLVDYYGDTPLPPAPAYVQFAQGVPWQDLSTDDLIYIPFRPQSDSPYGVAPLESVLLTANTDLRMQAFFLDKYTSGTVPQGFASVPPELSTPDQIQAVQDAWDAMLYGDQEKLHQLLFVAHGTQFTWAKDGKFDKDFQLYMIGQCAAAFHITMNDLGFTQDVNRATGETQVDVQERIGTGPLVNHIEEIITDYLQEDRGLPVAFKIGNGKAKEDRLQEAQTWKCYIESGMASPDEGREQVLGLPIDNERPIPRFINHNRLGPLPLLGIVSAAGRIDGDTYGPAIDQPELPDPVAAVPVIPAVGTAGAKADLAALDARQEAARAALHPDAAPHAPVAAPAPAAASPLATAPTDGPGPVQASITAGVTTDTGITGNPLVGGTTDGSRFWTEDEVRAIGRQYLADHPDLAQRVQKAAPTVAGLAVKAADTGRVLLLQRALDGDLTCPVCRGVGEGHPDIPSGLAEARECSACDGSGRRDPDPAAGTWELPGGHLEEGEEPLAGACREWAEEVGCTPPPGVQAGSWMSPNGVYQGIVWVIPSESDVTINLDHEDRDVTNPDDPGGDQIEAVAWFTPADLPGMPALRGELAATVDTWLPVVEAASMSEEVRKGLRDWRRTSRDRVTKGRAPRLTDGAGLPAHVEAQVWDVLEGARTRPAVDAAFRRVVKARGRGKGRGRWRELAAPDVPQRRYDLRIVDHYTPLIQAALGRLWPSAALRAVAAFGDTISLDPADTGPLRAVLGRLWVDSWATGQHSARLQVARVRKDDDQPEAEVTIDWGRWEPGNLDAAVLAADGGFQAALLEADITIKGLVDTTLERLGNVLSEGLLNGDSVNAIGRAMQDELGGDADRAELIAHTESARMQTLATFDGYADAGIRQWDWLTTAGACPRCLEQEAANPHPLGDPGPPGHPRCRCAAAPVWDSI